MTLTPEITPPLWDDILLQATLNTFFRSGQVREVRALEGCRPGSSFKSTWSGYFQDPSHVLPALRSSALGYAKGIYFTMNEVVPACLARGENRLEERSKNTTSREHIARLRLLLVDADPVRNPKDVSSTDEEKGRAAECLTEVIKYLCAKGFPLPIICDSGNGWHLLYPLDLPPEEHVLVTACLESLDARFSNDSVQIDTSTGRAESLTKLYGTRASKGDHAPHLGRPWRLSRIHQVPQNPTLVPVDLLRLVADDTHGGPSKSCGAQHAPKEGQPPANNRLDVKKASIEQFIKDRMGEYKVADAVPYHKGWKWIITICPFNGEHNRGERIILLKSDGTTSGGVNM